MKVKILSVLCILLTAVCVLQFFFLVRTDKNDPSGKTDIQYVNASSDDIQFKLALTHIYYESNTVLSTLPFTTIQISESALIKAYVSSDSGAMTAALKYVDDYSDRTLASAFETMDDILDKFDKILKKYNITSQSSYTAKYNKLKTLFSSVKNSSNELLSRTRSLIRNINNSDYDTYYTKYVEQLNDLSSKLEEYCTVVMDEYDTLIQSISDEYEIIK